MKTHNLKPLSIVLISAPILVAAAYIVKGDAASGNVVLGAMAIVFLLALVNSSSSSPEKQSTESFERHMKDTRRRWDQRRPERFFGSQDIECAIASFRTYIETEGAGTLIEEIQPGTSYRGANAQQMLERAAFLFPDAYRTFNIKGERDSSTNIARSFFLDVMNAVIVEKSSCTDDARNRRDYHRDEIYNSAVAAYRV